MAKRAVCVTSGGSDSIPAGLMMLNKGYEIHYVHFDIGQRSRLAEAASCKKIVSELQEKGYPVQLYNIKAPVFGKETCLLENTKVDIPKGMESLKLSSSNIGELWVPARNVVFLSIAASLAEDLKAEYITLGGNASEEGYGDNTQEFMDRFTKMLEYGCNNFKPKCIMPERGMHKPDVLKWCWDNGFGWLLKYTWSCDERPTINGNNPNRDNMISDGECGCCCNRRIAHLIAEQKWGIKDEQKYANDNYFYSTFIPEALETLETKLGKNMWYKDYKKEIENGIVR